MEEPGEEDTSCVTLAADAMGMSSGTTSSPSLLLAIDFSGSPNATSEEGGEQSISLN